MAFESRSVLHGMSTIELDRLVPIGGILAGVGMATFGARSGMLQGALGAFVVALVALVAAHYQLRRESRAQAPAVGVGDGRDEMLLTPLEGPATEDAGPSREAVSPSESR